MRDRTPSEIELALDSSVARLQASHDGLVWHFGSRGILPHRSPTLCATDRLSLASRRHAHVVPERAWQSMIAAVLAPTVGRNGLGCSPPADYMTADPVGLGHEKVIHGPGRRGVN